ncbi:MAG: response regulator [Candidatus Scalindua sp.]|jgi:response regulator RpfG family c-di-GMP phosphodiesterase|nr:response regulator [Candidatus Scalindua sp.]MBT5306946.1 response regulator [Candidatus Scalindua sp.]MBT6053218.1 response regulator [Candidatus Scalindua sp.]MBT6562850.1 response regulator [Candidatus Scalindua sp.]MBT7212327.1 response regulator [Candidatus Scalindua sp.]
MRKNDMNENSYEQEKTKVMVVDDDDSVLKTTTLILEEEGYLVEAFSTGKEAIDKFNNNIHAIVLDINMPDLTGLQVFKKIKSINPYVPIIFHTGTTAKQGERRDLRRQFRPHAYVQKGDPEQLMDTVVSAVESYGNILRNVKLSESLYEELKKSSDKIKTNIEDTIHAMAMTVEMRDPYTAGHQRQVANFASSIAEKMSIPKEQIDSIHLAGTIHDIGKMQVPTEILSKCGKLTGLEYDMIKTHPQAGYDILKTIRFQWPIAEFVLQHHERMDGSGYPSGLSGNDILIEAKILSVADVVDAIVPHRPYRPALGIEKAKEEISNNRGILYDSNVVDACLSIISDNNVGLNVD